MSSENHWYFAFDGQPCGPFPFDQLKQEAIAGRVTRQSLVWAPGMPNWVLADSIDDLWQREQSASAVIPERNASAAKPVRNGIIAKPETIEDASEAIRRGALAGYVFAGMYVLGGLLPYAAGYDFAWGTKLSGEAAFNSLTGFLVIAVLIAGLSYWSKERGSIAVPLILGLWFMGEVFVKLANQPRFNPFWLILYGFVAAGFLSGVRGALFLRRARKAERRARSQAQQIADSTTADVVADELSQNHKTGSFFMRHWRGELALPVSYWVVGFALNLALLLVATALGEGLGRVGLTPAATGAALLALFSAVMIIAVWQSVGIWRSAGAHNRKTGRRMWGTLARLAVLLGVVQFAAQLHTLGPMAQRSIELALGIDDTPPYELRLLREGTEVELSGGMSTGSADALKNILDAAPNIQVVHLNSVGGWIAEGYKIKQLISERKLATYTSAECVSACTIAFLGGVSRHLSPHGKLGFHSGSFGTLSGDAMPELNDDMAATLRARGAPAWFVQKALSTSPQSMWYPTQKELLESGIISSVVDANQFALSGVGSIWRDSDAVRTTLEHSLSQSPLWAALKAKEPQAQTRMLAEMTRGVTQGRAMLDVQNEMFRTISSEVLPKYLKSGHDAELVAYWKVQIDEMKHLRDHYAQACVEFLFPEMREQSFDLTALLTEELKQRDLDALANLLRAGLKDAPLETTKAPSPEEFAAVVDRTSQTVPEAADVIGNPKGYTDQPFLLCNALTVFYSQVLLLPRPRAAAMLRYLMSSE